MIILHMLKHSLHASGNACAAVDLACTQAQAGHNVFMVHGSTSFATVLAQWNVTSIIVPSMRSTKTAPKSLYDLHRLLRRVRPDVVHCHMMMSTVTSAVLRPLLGYKLVTTVHNDFQRTAKLMTLGQRVIGVSDAVTRNMISRGVPASRMRTVLNGTIGSPRRPPPMPPAMTLKRPAITTVCGMNSRKGIPDLIDAFAIVLRSLPSAHLYIVGSGPMQEEYQIYAARVSEEAISFLGHMDDPRPILLGSDVFVLASHVEPAGLVLCEAREAGCAVVTTHVGGTSEMVDGGRAGILVPPHQPTRLASVLVELLQDQAYLAEMRRRATVGLQHFTLERVAAEVEQVYGELLEAPGLITACA